MYNAKLDETLQNYEQEFQKRLSAKDNILEEINYKIVQLFSKINNQEETQQNNSRDFNKLIQDLESNSKNYNTNLSKEINAMVDELKEKYNTINAKFNDINEEQKKALSELENKFKFKYIQMDQILEAYKEDFKECANKKEIEEILGQLRQTTTLQLKGMEETIENHQNSSEKELTIVHKNVADQLHKLEEEFAQVKTNYMTQSDYKDIIEKIDHSSHQYNTSIQEINQMIDRMNRSLEIIDTNLINSVDRNYKDLTSKVDHCMTKYNSISDSSQTIIQNIKDEIEKIKETFTTQKKRTK